MEWRLLSARARMMRRELAGKAFRKRMQALFEAEKIEELRSRQKPTGPIEPD